MHFSYGDNLWSLGQKLRIGLSDKLASAFEECRSWCYKTCEISRLSPQQTINPVFEQKQLLLIRINVTYFNTENNATGYGCVS